MAIVQRTAHTIWNGALSSGAGHIDATGSPLDGLKVSWAARTGEPGDNTNPEELLAAAHSSCFAMALTLRLTERKLPPERLHVESTVTLDEVGGVPTIVSSLILVKAKVPGIDASGFQTVVDEAAELCPVSRLFAGARINVEALLEPV